jgi:hypothetical protein
MFVQVWRLFRLREALSSPLFLPLQRQDPSLHGYCGIEKYEKRFNHSISKVDCMIIYENRSRLFNTPFFIEHFFYASLKGRNFC